MSDVRELIRQKQNKIRRLEAGIRRLQKENHIAPSNISIHSQLTTILEDDDHLSPCLLIKQALILHSTTNTEYRVKKSKKIIFSPSAHATSTPKHSPIHNNNNNNQPCLYLKPHQTSTPRRTKRHSTNLPINDIIPLKRLMYKKNSDQHKRRHSAAPFSKRSIIPRLHPIEENSQWI